MLVLEALYLNGSNGCYSDFLEIIIGVPQGSVLGPIMFIIYINSLFFQKFRGNVTAFADDTCFVYRKLDYPTLIVDVNHDLILLSKWFYLHKLVISSKTKHMFFNLGNPPFFEHPFVFHSPCCSMFNTTTSNINTHNLTCSSFCFTIENVTSFKYLGLFIDFQLSWFIHVNYLKKCLFLVIRQLFHLRSYCSFNLLRIIYFALFNSKLQYGITCWGGTSYTRISPLLVAQKFATKVITRNNRRCESFPVFNRLNVLPFRHLFVYTTCKIFFLRSGYLNRRIVRSYNLRVNNNLEIIVPRARIALFSQGFDVVAPHIFNKLPPHLKNNRSLSNFLRELKTFLFTMNLTEIELFLRNSVYT